MEKENAKAWERPWTTDEIREHSASWNLAGDSGLLNHLQQFSENLLTRTHETEVSLNKLMEDMKTSSTEIQNVMNTFLSLANTQFVENRVYDDDEKETPPDEKKEDEKVKTKEEHEAEVLEKVKEALHLGMALLDTHFEAVEMPASDSEEDESSASVGRLILKPRDMYSARPLPYIIGSQEFMEDDKVGLGDMSSDTEESPDQNLVQSSESDEEIEHDDMPVIPKTTMVSSSSDSENSEPESDRGGSVVKQKPLRGGGMGATEEEEEGDMFGQESPPEADVLSAMQGALPSALTDELSAKWGGEKHASSPKVKKKDNDNMFLPSSEPEEENSLFSGSFSGGRGLFDDLDDWNSTSNSLWKTEKDSPTKPTDKAPKGLEKEGKQQNLPEGKLFETDTPSQSLFEDNHEEDDLFSTSQQKPPRRGSNVLPSELKRDGAGGDGSILSKTVKASGGASATSNPFSSNKDDVEDDLFAVGPASSSSQNASKRKVLPGAVPVLSGVSLFGDKPPLFGRNKPSEGTDDDKRLPSNVSGQARKSLDIPASDVHSVSSPETAKPQSRKDGGVQNDELFQPSAISLQGDKEKKSSNLFADDDNDEEDENDVLFSKPKKISTVNKIVPVPKPSMFGNTGAKPKKTISLFDDSDSGDDELLFSSTSSTSSRSRRSQASGDLLAVPTEKKILPKKALDDLFFGINVQEDPGFDIFDSREPTTVKQNPSASEKIGGSASILDSAGSGKKVTTGLFDDIDEVDDIFAITKASTTVKQSSSNVVSVKPQNNLFLESNDDADDIFSSKSLVAPTSDTVQSVKEPLASQLWEDTPALFVDKEVSDESRSKPAISQKPPVIGKKPSSLPPPAVKPKPKLSDMERKEASEGIKTNSSDVTIKKDEEIDHKKESEKPKKSLEVHQSEESHNQKVQSSKPEPPRTLNIRKTTDVLFGSPSNEDDLFESSWSEKVGDNKVKTQKKDLDGKVSSNALSGLLSDYIAEKDTRGPQEAGPKEVKEESEDNSTVKRTERPTPKVMKSLESRLSPGRFVIDPKALLPGAKFPGHSPPADPGVGFDKPVETSGMLHSAAKERVKIQVKRRPQSRRARQEALRVSSIDYDNVDAALISQMSENKNNTNDDFLENHQKANKHNDHFENLEGDHPEPTEERTQASEDLFGSKIVPTDTVGFFEGNSNPLSPSTDEEDFFAVPQELPYDETSHRDQIPDYKNMFGGAPVLSPVDTKSGTSSIFETAKQSEDISTVSGESADMIFGESTAGNDNIFGGSEETVPSDVSHKSERTEKSDVADIFSEPQGGAHLPPKESGGMLSNQFNFDDSDDDDLFSSVRKNNSGNTNLPKDKHNFITDDFSLFPPKSTDDFEPSRSSGRKGEGALFSPVEEDPDNLFGSKPSVKRKDSDKFDSSNFLNVDSVVKTVSSNDSKSLTKIQQQPEEVDDFPSVKSVEVNKQPQSQSSSLFGDYVESDDLFSSSLPSSRKVVTSTTSKLKGSLFDDAGDDDDDIFSASAVKSNRLKIKDTVSTSSDKLFSETSNESSDLFLTKASTSKSTKGKHTSVQKKTSSEETFEDPLMAIKK